MAVDVLRQVLTENESRTSDLISLIDLGNSEMGHCVTSYKSCC